MSRCCASTTTPTCWSWPPTTSPPTCGRSASSPTTCSASTRPRSPASPPTPPPPRPLPRLRPLAARPPGRARRSGRRRLLGAAARREVPRLDLPLDRPRPARPAHRAAACSFTLDRTLTLALKELARQTGATPYMALLTVFTTLMHRYTGQRDIWIGSATSSRGRPAFHDVLGYFANIMVVRTRIEPRQTFRSLLDQVRKTVLDGLEHQDFPYPMVIQRLAERRSDSGSPLFDVAFHYESSLSSAQRGLSLIGTGFTDAEIAVGDIVLRPHELAHHGSEHDLTLFVEEIDDTLYCSLRYAVDLFDRATVRDMADHLTVLAGECVRRPDAGLGTLPILAPDERHRILTAWNRPDDGVSTSRSCAHHLVIAQAERTPTGPPWCARTVRSATPNWWRRRAGSRRCCGRTASGRRSRSG
ncbi:condensation domain-containing protein [Streptosporangium lutulentum]